MKILSTTAILLASFALSSCGVKSLKQLEAKKPVIEPLVVKSSVEICNIVPSKEIDKLGIFFIIDVTGSNATNVGAPGNDADKSQRYGQLSTWLAERRAKYSPEVLKNEDYAIMQFASGRSRINAGAVNPDKPFLPIEEFETLVQSARAYQDNGGTPYKETLTKAKEHVELDLQKMLAYHAAHPDEPIVLKNYVFIFLSDGRPCTAEDGGYFTSPDEPGACNLGLINKTSITDKVKSLIQFDSEYKPFVGSMVMNTGYYNKSNDVQAETLLTEMADAGNGKFSNFNNGAKINYDELVKYTERRVLKEVAEWFTENRSIIWDYGYMNFVLDTDNDGLEDYLEHPACVNKYSCLDDGVRDGVRFEVYSERYADPEIAFDRSLCYDDLTGQRIDFDNDGLLDCEEMLLKTNKKEIDTNFDGIFDETAFYTRYFLTKETNETSSSLRDTDFDGISDYQEIKRFTPWKTNNTRIDGIKPMGFKQVDSYYDPVARKSCIIYDITDIPKGTETDLIKVTILDKERFGAGSKSVRCAYKRMDKGLVSIKDGDLKENCISPHQ
jgi:hypothetical protein